MSQTDDRSAPEGDQVHDGTDGADTTRPTPPHTPDPAASETVAGTAAPTRRAVSKRAMSRAAASTAAASTATTGDGASAAPAGSLVVAEGPVIRTREDLEGPTDREAGTDLDAAHQDLSTREAGLVDDDAWDEEDWDGEYAAAVPEQPVVRTSRRRKRKEWRRTEKARRYAARRSVRFPIFTRSVLLWMLLFALVGVAFGGSGAIFWAHFNTQITELKEQTSDFDKRSKDAQGQIDAMRNQAITDINNQIKPIAPYIAESKTIQIAPIFSPYVWFVETLDENGEASVGTAFAVATDDQNTLMVTSLNTVKAASVTPAPEIDIKKGQDSLKATFVSFDADRDLALLQVPRGGMQIMDWATDEQQSQALGLRVFAVSGFGAAGASLTSGVISDQNSTGFLYDAAIGTMTQGGPVVTADAKVLGVASISYRPLGFDPGQMHFSIPINQVCVTLMECGGGARRAKTTGKPPAPKPTTTAKK